ncbi:hypothetical protein AHAS_Ahas11G0276200 [Arachis hypogaea]
MWAGEVLTTRIFFFFFFILKQLKNSPGKMSGAHPHLSMNLSGHQNDFTNHILDHDYEIPLSMNVQRWQSSAPCNYESDLHDEIEIDNR